MLIAPVCLCDKFIAPTARHLFTYVGRSGRKLMIFFAVVVKMMIAKGMPENVLLLLLLSFWNTKYQFTNAGTFFEFLDFLA